jgi:hypothetical protein
VDLRVNIWCVSVLRSCSAAYEIIGGWLRMNKQNVKEISFPSSKVWIETKDGIIIVHSGVLEYVNEK